MYICNNVLVQLLTLFSFIFIFSSFSPSLFMILKLYFNCKSTFHIISGIIKSSNSKLFQSFLGDYFLVKSQEIFNIT